MINCPQCGGDLKYSERLKRYYCDDCGYRVSSLEEVKNSEEKLTIEEQKEKENVNRKIEIIDEKYVIDCPYCEGELLNEKEKIICGTCGKEYKIPEKKSIKEDKEIKKDKLNIYCTHCKGEYYYNELTGKLACKTCGYQPSIANKEKIVDEDKSRIKVIECNSCGSNSGYEVVDGKIICKSCHREIEMIDSKTNKIIDKDGIVAKHLKKQSIICKNCGQNIEGFDFYKTELCPNCGTINVVIEDENSLRVEPNKIVPFSRNKEEILGRIKELEKLKGIKINLQGKFKKVYIPFWHFHFEGAKFWFKKKYSYEDKFGVIRSMILEEGKEEMPLPDMWISAKENFGSAFDLGSISLEKAENYSPNILDTYVERYDVGTTEAYTIANDEVYEYLYDTVWNRKKGFKLILANFMELDFGTYKKDFFQVLLPFWEGRCVVKNKECFFTISDVTGEIVIYGLDE